MGDYDRRLAQAQDFADGWQRRAEAAEAERDRLRAIVEDPHGAVEAMHRRLDESMSEQAVLVAERERLREAVRWMRKCPLCSACRRKATETLDALDGSAVQEGGT